MKTEEIFRLFNQKGFITESEKNLLSAVYYFQQCEATAPQLAQVLGYSHFAPVNSIVGRLGKKIGEALNIPLRQRDNGTFAGWDVIFFGENTDEGFLWTLKDEIKEALEKSNWLTYDKIPEEIDNSIDVNLIEGSSKKVSINSYERNPIARKLCVERFGYKCFVCGFDFEEFYGEIGKEYIHVHHIKPISEIGKEYKINPETDLKPVCPNCHSMIHRFKETLSIEELKEKIQKNARHST